MSTITIPHPETPAHVDNLRSLELLLAQDFSGSDASLSESLFCYGMAWRDLGNEWLVIYRHPSIANRFDRCTIAKDYNVAREHNWVKLPAIHSFTGTTAEEWDALDVLTKLSDLVSYHGIEEIFGSSYWHCLAG